MDFYHRRNNKLLLRVERINFEKLKFLFVSNHPDGILKCFDF